MLNNRTIWILIQHLHLIQQLKKDSEVSDWVWVKTENYKINFHKNKHLYTFSHLDTFAYVLSFLSLFAIGYWFMLYSVSSSLGTGNFFPLLSSTGSGDSSPNNSPNCPTTIKQLAENGEGTEKHWTSRTDLSFSKWKYKHGDHFKDRWWEPYWVVSYKIRTEFKKRLSQMSKTVSKK